MDEVQIKLAMVWVALMLTYLLGDVLRIFSGGFEPGELSGTAVNPLMYLGLAVMMVIPIIMVVLTLFLPPTLNRWASIIVALLFFLFNLAGLPTYPGWYDRFLIVVGLAFNLLIVWLAWRWV